MKTIKNNRRAARFALGLAMFGNLLAAPLASQAATYSYTELSLSGFAYSSAYGISGRQQVGSGADYHALLWTSTSSNVVDLNPAGFISSYAHGILGGQQVGGGYRFTGNYSADAWHALLWSGTASSAVDLHPGGFIWSGADGISGSQQVGWGQLPFGDNYHALLWSGSASSVVDLNPSGFTSSEARGISGSQQVGWGWGAATGGNYMYHALLWSGTASSVVDLNPTGFTISMASGNSGNQQVGHGWGSATGGNGHALQWSGTAGSVMDLHPTGFMWSSANGISGGQQVGSGYTSEGVQHALLWSGTASSVVDLHSFLSSDYSSSEALGIDANGNVVGRAFRSGAIDAILWTVVHEPVVLCNDRGQCGAIWTYSTGPTNTTCNPASGSLFPVGTTTVACTTTYPLGIPPYTYTFTVTVNDCESPIVSCRPTHKPSGKSGAKSDNGSEHEEDVDGFYQLLGNDNCDPNPRLYVRDSASGFVAGPFANGDIVKITKKAGDKGSSDAKDSKSPRSPIVAHIRLQGNGLLYGVDASGNAGTSVLCRVPHWESDLL